MTEIAARAKAPIGSLYQFFPSKEALADTLVQSYVALLTADLEALEAQARNLSTAALIEGLFGVLRAHPQERAATLPLAEARMDERTRRETFRYLLRKRIASILRARSPTLSAERALRFDRLRLARSRARVAAAAVSSHQVADVGAAGAVENAVSDLDRDVRAVVPVGDAHRYVGIGKEIVDEEAIA